MTTLEVYNWVMEEARYHKEQNEKLFKKFRETRPIDLTLKNDAASHATAQMCFYQVAAKLELTPEINPPK